MHNKAYLLNVVAWGLSVVTILLALGVWFNGLPNGFTNVSLYQVFPLLGLMAFSLMWTHYIMSALRQHLGLDPAVLGRHFETTSLIVLTALLLHPGLLIYQLGRDGFGYSPTSVFTVYVAPSLRWAAALGATALLIFLAYELRRKYDTRSWWKWVSYASDIAMFAVFIHALQLGRHLQYGWYSYVWWFYGVTLLISVAYIYHRRFNKPAHLA